MADEELANLTAATSVAATDIFYTVVDPAGTPLDRKIAASDLATTLANLVNLPVAYTLSPSSDTYINQQSATTNYDTATTVWMGEKFDTSASFGRIALFTFDISSFSTKTIVAARLRLMRDESSPAAALSTSNRLVARNLKRAYVAAEVTWNIYSTGNNWGTAGARGAADVETPTYNVMAVRGDRDQDTWTLEMTDCLKDAITAGYTTNWRFLLGWAAATDSQNSAQMGSINHGTAAYRPVLTVLAHG